MQAAHKPHPLGALHASTGFTLIEILVVLFLVSLLLGALLGPVSLRLEAERRQEGLEYLKTAREALIGFAMRNGRLPCPDNSGTPDGIGDGGIANNCTAVPVPLPAGCDNPSFRAGLPYADIGVPPRDPWGRPIAYHVSNAMVANARGCPGRVSETANSTSFLTLAATGALAVADRDTNKAQRTLVTSLAAVLISRGPSNDGTERAGSDELRNTTPQTTYILRPPNRVDQACSDTVVTQPSCHFDDLIEWIPTTVLQYHLVNAGRLPP